MGELRRLQDNDQPVPVSSGLFVLPQLVKCSGTLVGITAHGFCIRDNDTLTETTDIQYRMILWIGHLNHTNQKYTRARIMKVDGNCSSTSNASHGTLSSDYIGHAIFRGDMLGISIDECKKNECPFVPAIQAESDSTVQYYSKVKFNSLTAKVATFLNLQASIHIRKSVHIHTPYTMHDCVVGFLCRTTTELYIFIINYHTKYYKHYPALQWNFISIQH